ncbi:MAG: metallophosphatase family protein [candidate division KSB1 bacterium]|nr:metallophosphatase family protein [candidate division KSB1 bacterium]
MRYLILSDVHANLVALEAVLADAPAFDKIWCLGDLVGYGPSPNECIERIQDFSHLSLAGNHDWAALGKLDLGNFNTDARVANAWTQAELHPAARQYLDELPTFLEQEGFYLAHASPREPVWEYVLDASVAYANFAYFSTSVCLVGHTHIPLIFELDEQRNRCETIFPPSFEPLTLDQHRLIINPGSVGQPRDGDPRASYALLDTESLTWELRRVAYPVEVTQERMRARGLPRRLIDRLEIGR